VIVYGTAWSFREVGPATPVLNWGYSVPADVAETLAQLCGHQIAGEPTRSAIGYLVELFGERRGPGIRMAANALQVAMPEARVATIATGYTQRLTAALANSPTNRT